MRYSLGTAFDILLVGESAPTHIESTPIRVAVIIVAALLGAIVAFMVGWSTLSTIVIVYVTMFSLIHLAGYIVNQTSIEG